MATYQAHPVHQRFLGWIADRSSTPLAFDYHLDATTVFHPEPVPTPKESS
ncbi:MAG: hypothetical protein ACR2JG_14070 [Geodermatophilaceae bacterium]